MHMNLFYHIMYKKQYLLIVLNLFAKFSCLNMQDYPESQEREPVDGEFTSDLKSYEFLVPQKISSDGEFISFSLPNFFRHDYASKRRRRGDGDPEVINYNLHFNGRNHHVQLWPNHGFLSPETIAEYHYPGSETTILARKLRKVNPALCHYTGAIKGMDGSRAALSLCNGMAGYLKTDQGVYYIESVKDFCANGEGHHLHLVYTPDEHEVEKKSVEYDQNASSLSSSSSTPNTAKLHTNCGTHEDWREGWKRAFDEPFRVKEEKANNQHRRSSDKTSPKKIVSRKAHTGPQHRYLEVLVVADKMFMDYHTDKDQENYILTVMNMASDYFHDSSTGSQLDVVVVRVIYLDETISALDLSATPEAGNTLKSFCKWQNEINPKDPGHPQHHDIAVLITSMGCQHDCSGEVGCPTDSGCPAKVHDAFNHVMAPYVTLATTIWSQCSRSYMRELLDNNLGECLTDEPEESTYKYEEMLAGVVYDADYQCSLIFTNSTHCPVEPHVFCERLFCKVSSSKCLSNGQPPADGTKCSANKWCFKRRCIGMGERPNSVDGGWSRWTDYGPCSRPCGGGVQVSERSCSNPHPQNSGLYCIGDEKRYKICNTKTCPEGTPSFRAIQCSEFDKIPRNGKFHRWTPYFPGSADGPGTCILYCINEEHVYAKLSPRIKDGTPCRIGTMDMCIKGQCRKIGCDWVIDSEAVNDKCGVCGGDNSGCKHITGYFSNTSTGYIKVVTLPKGARNIIIRENASSENTIAIADKHGKFVLNGDNREESDGEKSLGKDSGIYVHPGTDQEELYIPGPLHQSLVFYVAFYQPRNPGFTYEYYIRDKNFKPRKRKITRRKSHGGKGHKRESQFRKPTWITSPVPPQYHWDFVEWSNCNLRCDGGEKISNPVCVDTHSGGGVVSEEFCDDRGKPEVKSRVCNRQACRAKWHTGEWGVCTGCKHQPGFQQRHVWCAIESPRWEETDTLTSNEKCKQDGAKPKTRRLCTNSCTPACQRSIRDVNDYLLPINMDVNFYLAYYTRIDTIDLNPEQRDLEIVKLSAGKAPVKCPDSAEANSGCSKVVLSRTSCPMPIPTPKATPCPYSTSTFDKPEMDDYPCPSQPSLYKNTIAVDFPVASPFDGDATGSIFISSKKFKKSNYPATEKIKGIKASLLASSNPLASFKDHSTDTPNHSEPSRLTRQRLHHKEAQRPTAMILVEHPDLKDIRGPTGRFSPRLHGKLRHGRDTIITKPRHSVVSDKVPEKSLVVIEAPLKESSINLSDFTFEHMGDMASGSLDLDHQKQLCGKKAIQALQHKKNGTTESSTE